jgi:hypothetical protein
VSPDIGELTVVVPLEIVIVGMRVIPSPKLGYFNRCSKQP